MFVCRSAEAAQLGQIHFSAIVEFQASKINACDNIQGFASSFPHLCICKRLGLEVKETEEYTSRQVSCCADIASIEVEVGYR